MSWLALNTELIIFLFFENFIHVYNVSWSYLPLFSSSTSSQEPSSPPHHIYPQFLSCFKITNLFNPIEFSYFGSYVNGYEVTHRVKGTSSVHIPKEK